MAYQGLIASDVPIGINGPPPTGCYFEVTFFPGYMNGIKIAKILKRNIKDKHRLQGIEIIAILASSVVGIGAVVGAGVGAGVGVAIATALGINPLDFRFNKVSGLATTIETQEIRVGGLNTEMLQLPNRVKHGNLVLERGIFVGSPLTVEFNVAMSLFQMIPGEILVTLQAPDHSPRAAWFFRNAYPVAWSNSNLWSDDSKVVMEKMEFAYSHFYPLRF